jgi:vacuole morphology and inheritance protein 14
MKDIVAESASVYVPQYPATIKISQLNHQDGVLIPRPGYNIEWEADDGVANKAFSLAHFIPLLAERIYVVSPFARSFLVSWVTVLDSVPELELVSYFPEFLDGLM